MKSHHKMSAALAGMVLSLSAFATIVQPGLAPRASDKETGDAAVAAMPWHVADAEPSITVGDKADPERLSLIAEPGLYGLSNAPGSSKYGIIDDQLVRVENGTGKILSVLRHVEVVER